MAIEHTVKRILACDQHIMTEMVPKTKTYPFYLLFNVQINSFGQNRHKVSGN